LDLERLTDEELVAVWFHANAELHRRGTKLWHAGDLAEMLVAASIGGSRARSNVERGYDLIAPDGARWQVKALVNRPGNKRSSVGFLRQGTYDVLAIVAFAEDMRAVSAWRVPADVVPDFGRWHDERNAFRLTLTNKLLADPRVGPVELDLPVGPAFSLPSDPR
jgi:hypothetical protein